MADKTRGGRWLKLGLRQSMLNQGLVEPNEGERIMDPQRTISDADAKTIAKYVLDEAVARWYTAAGKSFTRLCTYVIIAAIGAAALIFYVKGK